MQAEDGVIAAETGFLFCFARCSRANCLPAAGHQFSICQLLIALFTLNLMFAMDQCRLACCCCCLLAQRSGELRQT